MKQIQPLINRAISSAKNAIAAISAFALTTSVAIAQTAGLDAGIATATSVAKKLINGMYIITGIVIIGYLIWLFIQCLTEKKQWMDLIMGIVWCCVGGAIIGIAGWAYTVAGSATSV